MKQLLSLLLCLMLLCLPACGRRQDQGESQTPGASSPPSARPARDLPDPPEGGEDIPAGGEGTTAAGEGQRILIAYFTWAENTVVEDVDAAVQGALDHYGSIGDAANYNGADAVSSASVVVPSNTAKMAGWIRQRTGGELFSILVEEPYPSDYDACLDRAAAEKAENARPVLTGHVENMGDYDIVFLGFPNWWYTVPMAVHSFLEEYDFSGKTVIPFCAHGTGGLAGTVRDITAALPDSVTVLEPIGIYRPEVDSAQGTVEEWLDKLGFPDAPAEEESPADPPYGQSGVSP